MEVRGEIRADERAIEELVRLAFEGRDTEPALVRALREGNTYIPELALVALSGGVVIGHLMLTTVELVPDDGSAVQNVLALAPVAVHPDHQGNGVGKFLVDTALRRCFSQRMEPFVVVLGSEQYYPRFGFTPAAEAGVRAPFPVDDKHFMIRRLPAFRLAKPGLIRYPPAFDDTTEDLP